MLKIEKINKVISVRIEGGNLFFTPLFFKAFSISLILHLLFFYLFTVAVDRADEGIILLPSKVEADKSVLQYLSSKTDTGILTYSSGILLKPLEKLQFTSPQITDHELPFLRYIQVPQLPDPSFSVIEENLIDEKALEFKSLILSVSVFSLDSIKIRAKCRQLLLEKVNSLKENFASFKLLIDCKTGKIVSFESIENHAAEAKSFEALLRDISFEPVDSLDTFTDIILEFNTIKSISPNNLVVFR
jgi:hypothetical protein